MATPPTPTPVPPKKSAPIPAPQAAFCASGFPQDEALPQNFVEAVRGIEAALKNEVWLLVQDVRDDSGEPCRTLDDTVFKAFLESKPLMPKGKPIALIIDSPGGQARSAYRLASFLREQCGGFTAIVPEYAKSAATLLVLGANNIILGPRAELGPLDTQVFDPDREGYGSALDEVQALERLNAFALKAVDEEMMLFTSRTGKSMEKLFPHVLHFVSEMVRPLFEKIDTVHYTQMSRLLKVAEEYAVRLLEPRYTSRVAEEIARRLVNGYPEHGFLIDRREAMKIGLKTAPVKDDLEIAFENFNETTHGVVAVGKLQEFTA
jgi:hypothetical protein